MLHNIINVAKHFLVYKFILLTVVTFRRTSTGNKLDDNNLLWENNNLNHSTINEDLNQEDFILYSIDLKYEPSSVAHRNYRRAGN